MSEVTERFTVPPCPSWCRFSDHPPNHDYDSESLDGTTESRFHISDVTGAYIAQEEFRRAGAVTFGAVHVSPSEFGGVEEMTAEQARAIAAQLVAAADQLDRLTIGIPA